MRRKLLGVAVVTMLALAAFTGGAPAAPGGGGPACADITNGSSNFPASTTGTFTLRFEAQLAAPACIGKVTYMLFVTTDTGIQEATLTGFSPEGNPQFQFSTTDSTICVFGTTSSKTGRVIDRAPNADSSPDCLALVAGGVGGGGGFN